MAANPFIVRAGSFGETGEQPRTASQSQGWGAAGPAPGYPLEKQSPRRFLSLRLPFQHGERQQRHLPGSPAGAAVAIRKPGLDLKPPNSKTLTTWRCSQGTSAAGASAV
jgi:hypothetical protein